MLSLDAERTLTFSFAFQSAWTLGGAELGTPDRDGSVLLGCCCGSHCCHAMLDFHAQRGRFGSIPCVCERRV